MKGKLIMTTEERLEMLEKSLACGRRFNRWLLAAFALFVAVWVVFGLIAKFSPKVIRANRLIIEDMSGRDRILLDGSIGAPGVILFDENNNICFRSSVYEGLPCLRLSTEKQVATLSITKDGPDLLLYDQDGNGNAWLKAGKLGPGLSLNDENGKDRIILGMVKGVPWLRLCDENSKARATMAVAKGVPSFGLRDENEEGRVIISASKDSQGFGVYDENGDIRGSLGLHKAGPGIGLYDENGKETWSAP